MVGQEREKLPGYHTAAGILHQVQRGITGTGRGYQYDLPAGTGWGIGGELGRVQRPRDKAEVQQIGAQHQRILARCEIINQIGAFAQPPVNNAVGPGAAHNPVAAAATRYRVIARQTSI